jgi:hypothetical protein
MEDIFKKFLGSSDLHFYGKIHYNLIEHLYHYLGQKKSNNNFSIGEETFQSELNEFLHNRLNNSGFKEGREENVFGRKRLDNYIYHESSGTVMARYELKTYFKESEVYVNKRGVYIDLIKLAIKKKNEPRCRTFFILAGKEKVLKNAFTGKKSLLLPNKFQNLKNRRSSELSLNFLKSKISKKNPVLVHYLKTINKPISVRPSVWFFYRGVAVISWGINKV